MICGQNSTAGVRARMLESLCRGCVSAAKLRGTQPRPRIHCKGCPYPDECPIGRRGLRRTSRSSPRDDLAPMFRPHLPEKYDGTLNPSEILAGLRHRHYGSWWKHCCNGKLLPCSLDRVDQTWLMNLTPGSVYSWEELYARFIANFASAYQQHGVQAHLHAVR
jgi:hypothetical protein